jgi:TetR/AcrR family transcriptional repressor of nem operon
MSAISNTRDQIIDTALQLLMQRGMNGFSYRDISEPLGIKNAAVHYHFPSKAKLVKSLIKQSHDALRKNTAEFMAYGGSAREQLEGLFEFTLRQLASGRPVCVAGALSVDFEELSSGTRDALNRFMMDTLEWFTRVLETGREQGEFQFKGEARNKAISVMAMIQGARQFARIHGTKVMECTFGQIRTDLGIEE